MLTHFPDGIHAFDSGFVRPLLDAIHLIEDAGRVAIVDSASNSCVPRLLAALDELGRAVEDVDYLLLTHIHLDHAGGAGALMARLPAARLVVHPRGARHMADPARLWAGTVDVYGEALAREMYGEPLPVPSERIVEAGDGLELRFSGRVIEVFDTPGHARHHVCYFDRAARAFFTGDTFGLSYRELDVDGRASIWPTTTPVQFDPPAMHASIDRMLACRPAAMYLTHYSRVTDVARLAADMHRLIDEHVAIAEAASGEGEALTSSIVTGLRGLLYRESERQGWTLAPQQLDALMAMDLQLNAQGLAVWLASRQRATV
ncbi:MAG: MBL fold metallo-hydrolase [Rhodocyclaceae bacterium]|nr:MBL fold metallo-hydrolase [Rhodocyclaceae bacterium]